MASNSPLPTIPRRRKNPPELQEAGKSMKEAMTSLNKVLNKPQVPEDDFDRYGKILANKLRKLSETDSLKMMYEIDGMFIRRLNATPTYLTRPSPTYYVRSESSCTSYSDLGVPAPHSSQAVSNPIQILSDEIVIPPTDPEYNIVSQAFYQA